MLVAAAAAEVAKGEVGTGQVGAGEKAIAVLAVIMQTVEENNSFYFTQFEPCGLHFIRRPIDVSATVDSYLPAGLLSGCAASAAWGGAAGNSLLRTAGFPFL